MRWRKKKTDEQRVQDIAEEWEWEQETDEDGWTVWRSHDWTIRTNPNSTNGMHFVNGPGRVLDNENNAGVAGTLTDAKENAVRGYLDQAAKKHLRASPAS